MTEIKSTLTGLTELCPDDFDRMTRMYAEDGPLDIYECYTNPKKYC